MDRLGAYALTMLWMQGGPEPFAAWHSWSLESDCRVLSSNGEDMDERCLPCKEESELQVVWHLSIVSDQGKDRISWVSSA